MQEEALVQRADFVAACFSALETNQGVNSVVLTSIFFGHVPSHLCSTSRIVPFGAGPWSSTWKKYIQPFSVGHGAAHSGVAAANSLALAGQARMTFQSP